jgi:hypothetical protein
MKLFSTVQFRPDKYAFINLFTFVTTILYEIEANDEIKLLLQKRATIDRRRTAEELG